MNEPKVLLLFSGKRKSGKDYICEQLCKLLGTDNCQLLRISEPIKSHYAKVNGLDLKELMSDNAYKETYRKDMIVWSEEVRRQDPGYFCALACGKALVTEIWIVSDIRRKTDIEWFKARYGDKVKTIRIFADDEVRVKRGWRFQEGVDDVASECDLDDFEGWDLKISNNDAESFEGSLEKLLNLTHSLL